ncbi:MAG: glutamine synthetase beta-grasp domain-containing protein [Candidatus Micrarchaeota archaeon]|nr:glutamine synthetase beta-grasp domain-containing protein [Candidatus Micrarchaeota archaeon]
MAEDNIEGVLERINADRYRWVDIQYTDFLGFFKTVTIPAKSLDTDSFKEGVFSVDRKSVSYTDGDSVTLIPDAGTFAVIPWEPSTVRFIASTTSPVDPRNTLGKLLSRDQKLAYSIGTEVDFYIVDAMVTDSSKFSYGAYFDARELAMSQYDGEFQQGARRFETMNADVGRAIRLQIGDYADLCGVDVAAMHHEKGRLQHEVALGAVPALKAADNLMTVKHLAKNAAMLVGAMATFVPKISDSEPMSELHINISAWKGGENAFFDMESGKPLSQAGYYFLAGIADHMRALSAFLLPSTLSYKDLTNVEKAKGLGKVYRIPFPLRGERDKRIEYRLADPTANPYLAYAALLAAGQDGISKKLSFDDRREVMPPRSLAESLSSLLSDHDFLKGVLSDDALHLYVELKEKDIKESYSHTSGFEITRYQNI